MTNSAETIISVRQGELAVSDKSQVVLAALLGSCVATCLWDPEIRVGGMNHVLLPDGSPDGIAENKYGVFAMEALINALMKQGARKANMVAKVFGGANTFENGMRIGESNAKFTREFLKFEGIPIAAESIGGRQARRLRFFPASGRVRQLLTSELPLSPPPPMITSTLDDVSELRGGTGEIELF